MRKFIFLTIVAMLLASCKLLAPINSEEQAEINQKFVESRTVRVLDRPAGVVCWVYFPQGGISCLPLSETKLGE